MFTIRLFIYFSFFLFSGCTSSPVSSPPSDVEGPVVDTTLTCQVDEDCVLVSKNCCPCNSGKRYTAVHKSQEASYTSDLEKYCSSQPNAECTHDDVCDFSFQAQCQNSQCVAVQDEPDL